MKPITAALPITNQVVRDDTLIENHSICESHPRELTLAEMAAVAGGPEIKNSIGG